MMAEAKYVVTHFHETKFSFSTNQFLKIVQKYKLNAKKSAFSRKLGNISVSTLASG
jgi:hypothetical protein